MRSVYPELCPICAPKWSFCPKLPIFQGWEFCFLAAHRSSWKMMQSMRELVSALTPTHFTRRIQRQMRLQKNIIKIVHHLIGWHPCNKEVVATKSSMATVDHNRGKPFLMENDARHARIGGCFNTNAFEASLT